MWRKREKGLTDFMSGLEDVWVSVFIILDCFVYVMVIFFIIGIGSNWEGV